MNAGLLKNHPATPRQAQLCDGKRRSRPSQADVLIAMLRDARTRGGALELPEIMKVGIAQHGARLNEIRSRGFLVVNETKHDGGKVCSRYFLMFDPERDGHE